MKEPITWIRIAYCRDIPLREGRAVKIGNREIAVFNLGDRFLAVDNRCPHKGGPLADGIVSGSTVVCPLHAWKISLETGKGVNGPSTSTCVDTLRIRVEGGVVLLQLIDERDDAREVQELELPLVYKQSEMEARSDYPSAAEA